MITSEKLVGGGYPEVDRVQWRKIDARYIVSLKEEFLTVMPLTTDFFMVLTLIGLRPNLETVRDHILGSSSVSSLNDVFAHLLRISSTQTLPSDNTSDSSISSTSQGIFLTDSEDDDYLRYQATKSTSVVFVAQTGNASACLTHTSSLGPWILDSGTSDHISGNKDLFSSITTTSALLTVTLANGSQTMAKGFGFAHPLPSLPLHSVLYAPEIGVREDDWHRTLSKFRKWSLVFHLCRHLRGYRCYSSETHRYFLSVDVTFFEDSPFFSTSESLPVSEVLPLPIISPPDAVPSCPLQVYHRHHRVVVPPSLAEVPADSPPIPSASPAPALPPSADLPIVLRKGWRQTMVDEMDALHSNGTWDLVVLPFGKSTVGCRWVYIVKVGPDGQILKMLSFMGIFLRKFIWSNHRFCCSGGVRFSVRFGMFCKDADHFLFYHHNSWACIYLDLGKLKYFLGIKLAQSNSGVVLSQRKYALDILEETGMLDCKPVDTPMDPNVKLILGQGEPLGDPGRYRLGLLLLLIFFLF
ncbi:hypothetical protein AAG906_019701 [Vitis piasezkii]